MTNSHQFRNHGRPRSLCFVSLTTPKQVQWRTTYIESMVSYYIYPIPACHVSQSGQHIVPTLPNVPKEKRAFLARSCKQKHQNMIIVIWSAWPFWRSLPSMYVLRNVAHLLHTWWLPNAKTLPSLFLASAALLRQLTGLTTRSLLE